MNDEPPFDAVSELLRLGDLVVPFAIRAASSLDLVAHLDHEPLPAERLAELLSVDINALECLLQVLASAGVVATPSLGAWEITDLGRVLRKDHPLSMRDAFAMATTEIRAFTELEHGARTGRAGFEHAYGETHRDYRARDVEEDIRMDRIHQAATRLDLLTLSRAYPWAAANCLVDVGGGTGAFLAGILHRYTSLHGVLFDLERMLLHAGEVLAAQNVSERCAIVAGSFFERVPGGGGLYVLKAVLGGWDDDSCIRILTNVRRAMPREASVLVIEPIMSCDSSRANVVQLHTFVLYGGVYRTADDYRRLADAADLEIRQVIPRATLSIIELIPKARSQSAFTAT